MLEYIRGLLVEAYPDRCTVELAGLGYLVLIPLSTYSHLPQIGSEVKLYLYTQIREDAHKLFGFLRREERDIFLQVTNISGIGPKIGLALIGHLDMGSLSLAIERGDTTVLSRVPGIGKKTAERLIIEMRGKLETGHVASSPTASPSSRLVQDAVSALINLGYNSVHAQKAVQKALPEGEELPLARLITSALQQL